MPVSPIDGAYYYPETHTYVSPLSVGVGAGTDGRARVALEAKGVTNYTSRASLAAGSPVRNLASEALEIGTPSRGVASEALSLTGYVRAVRGAGMALTVAPPVNIYAARIAQDVITSRLSASVARVGLVVNGVARGRHFPYSLTVRQQSLQSVGHSLSVRSYIQSLAREALLIGVEHSLVSRASTEIMSGDGFTVLADIVGQTLYDPHDITPVGYYPMQDINARLYVGGVEVAIRSFTYQEPKGRLGASLNVVLAEASRTLAPVNSSITFQLVVTGADEVEHPVTLVSNGKIGGRSYTVEFLKDELTIAGLNTLADKWALAPRRPIIMFDPELTNVNQIGVNVRDAVRTEKGAPILPSIEPVEHLSVWTALRRIYTGANGFQLMTRVRPVTSRTWSPYMSSLLGIGAFDVGLNFANVVTNIPDYKVSRVDISLESTWHDAAASLVGMYGPIYFVQSNILFIIDSQRALPAGHSPRTIPLSDYSAMAHSQPYRDPINAVLLTYQARGTDAQDTWAYREITETNVVDDPPNGFGTLAYHRMETRITTRQKYLLDDPANTIEEVELRNETRVYGHLAQLEPASGGGEFLYSGVVVGPIQEVSRETTVTTYNFEGLKSGHKKEVYGLVMTGPDASVEPVRLSTETCWIAWTQHPSDPSQMVQERNFTLTEGLIYVDDSRTESRLDPATGEMVDVRMRWPVAAANSSPGIIRDNGTLSYAPIRSVTEELRRGQGGQLSVVVRERDLSWSGTSRESTTTPRTGSRSANPYEARSRTILIRDYTSEAEIGPRVPASVSGGELPRVRAIELARRALKQGVMGQPPEPTLQIPGVDFAALQGSVIQGEYRDGTLTKPFIVEGRTITGSNLGQRGHRISMSLEGTELA